MNQKNLVSPSSPPEQAKGIQTVPHISPQPAPASPCISICALNDEGFCIGCYRDGNEIRLWNTYSDETKRQVLSSCQRRATLDQAFL